MVPAYLSELSPWARATFPGLAYQCGNLLAASNALIQTSLATLLEYRACAAAHADRGAWRAGGAGADAGQCTAASRHQVACGDGGFTDGAKTGS
ncbi:hypothetical protein RAA17_14590 [Komagataeibacter rhaeticus]|nr:hypothetical protein [Komagataeibacter rhaeticus]